MFLAGIDYSMTSPSICVFNGSKELNFDNCEFFVYTQKKPKFDRKNITFDIQEKYDCQEDRFDKISNWSLNILKKYEVKNLAVEGYSYGSKSNRLFDIGENGGLLKHKLWKNSIYFKIFTPSEVKKHFSGKGNSNKEKMSNALYEKENIKLHEDSESPVSDIIDSYAILRLLVASYS
jgi:Holliday junction resolvasome RuvABC endonuclease subunit